MTRSKAPGQYRHSRSTPVGARDRLEAPLPGIMSLGDYTKTVDVQGWQSSCAKGPSIRPANRYLSR